MNLDPRKARRIFEQRIRPTVTGVRRDRPTVLVVAGQPGAGKSSTHNELRQRLGLDGAYVHDADDLVRFHPGYRRAAKRDDLLADTECRPVVDEWDELALDHAISTKLDIVVTVPLARPEGAAEFLDRFRRAGYRVEVAFAAVHAAQSQLGILDRLNRGRQREGFGRWVPADMHDRMYRRLPLTADLIERDGLADGVHVFRRGGEVVHSNLRGADGRWQHPAGSTRAALEAARDLPWTADEIAHFVRDRAAVPPGLTPDTERVLSKIDLLAKPRLREYRQRTGQRSHPSRPPTSEVTGGTRPRNASGRRGRWNSERESDTGLSRWPGWGD